MLHIKAVKKTEWLLDQNHQNDEVTQMLLEIKNNAIQVKMVEYRPLMTERIYNEIIDESKNVSLWQKIKGFFKHVYLMSDLSSPSMERSRYRNLIHQFETLNKKAALRSE